MAYYTHKTMTRIRQTALGSLTLAFILAVPSLSSATDDAVTAQADMRTASGQDAGHVAFAQTPHGVLVRVTMQNISPGAHGFHLHETGSCANNFQAAGGHYNPHGKEHGLKNDAGPHAGDMPNIIAMSDSSAMAEFITDRVSLNTGEKATLMDQDGSAVIIHENADAHIPGETGGARLACGVITLTSD